MKRLPGFSWWRFWERGDDGLTLQRRKKYAREYRKAMTWTPEQVREGKALLNGMKAEREKHAAALTTEAVDKEREERAKRFLQYLDGEFNR